MGAALRHEAGAPYRTPSGTKKEAQVAQNEDAAREFLKRLGCEVRSGHWSARVVNRAGDTWPVVKIAKKDASALSVAGEYAELLLDRGMAPAIYGGTMRRIRVSEEDIATLYAALGRKPPHTRPDHL